MESAEAKGGLKCGPSGCDGGCGGNGFIQVNLQVMVDNHAHERLLAVAAGDAVLLTDPHPVPDSGRRSAPA